MYSDSIQIKACDWSQASKRCPWRVLANSKPNQLVPVQPFGRAFEGVRTPRSVLQITMKTSGRQSNTVRTLGQSLFNTKFDFRSRHWLGSLCKPSGQSGNTSGHCPSFQNIPVFHSNATRSYSEDRPNTRSSRPDVDLIMIELCCFWKDIA
jgi:hypothetical protein